MTHTIEQSEATSVREPLLEAISLVKKFPVYGAFGKLFGEKGAVHAVNDVSFRIYEGETYGLVGESGSGKSTMGRTLLGLTEATAGDVRYRGESLVGLSTGRWRQIRKEIQFVFQDPYASLNPRKRIGEILREPLDIHHVGSAAERHELVYRILKTVGLQPEHSYRYPHEFSGGQRQRIGLARALILDPRIMICDEPVSALDVSIQSQILNMLKDLQRELGLTMLFITHDMSVVRYISDRIGIMYLGKIMEEARTDTLFASPLHPYTQALFTAVPDIGSRRLRERIVLKGEIPSPLDPPSGCVFRTRCPVATEVCKQEVPMLREIAPEHRVACHFV